MLGPKVGQGLDSMSSISASVRDGLQNFKDIIAIRDLSPAQESTAVSHLARFRLWAGSLGAHRPSGSRSLEYRLRDASSMRRHVISLLHDLNALLADSMKNAPEPGDSFASLTLETVADGAGSPCVGAVPSDDVDEELARYLVNDQASGTKSGHDQLLESIGGTVDCLLRLSIAISSPAPHDQFKARAGEMLDFYAPWDVQHVRGKFPGLDVRMSDRLGKALTQRRQYFKYRKEHHQLLRSELDTLPGFEIDDESAERTAVASSLPEHLKDAPNLDSPMADALDPRDDRSKVSQTSYASSTAEPDALRVPPVPKEYTTGPFLCPFCQTMVSIDSRHAWKNHVFHDLRPYICLADDCPTPHVLYTRRHEWIRHVRDHWKVWVCPFECSGVFSSADDFCDHIQATHADKVSPGKVSTLETLRSRPDPTQIPEKCPLCLESDVRAEGLYESHVGRHLEQLALFSLPTKEVQDESEDDESEGGGRDSDTDNSEEAVTVEAVVEPPTTKRVKVYELRNNSWVDMGTGYSRVVIYEDDGLHAITVESEDNPERLLLETRISKDKGFQKKQEDLIVWTEPSNGRDMALSFQEADGCAAVWNLVVKIQRSLAAPDDLLHGPLPPDESL